MLSVEIFILLQQILESMEKSKIENVIKKHELSTTPAAYRKIETSETKLTVYEKLLLKQR